MARGAVYVCAVGYPRDLTDDQRAEVCRCKHERRWHWFGGGSCGECDGCDYFVKPRRKPAKARTHE